MKIRVMVVEDEPPILRAITGMIEQCDGEFVVTNVAKNGKEALTCLEDNSVDVIFTDIRMPVMDGLSLMEHVHSKYPNIFIVVLSGYQDFTYVKHALLHSAFDYILKPLGRDDLSDLLFRLKTAYLVKKNHQKSMMISRSINKSITQADAINVMGAQFIIMLLCAGAPAFMLDDITLPGTDYWDNIDWTEVYEEISEDSNENSEKKFWVFEGVTLTERIIIMEITKEEDIKPNVTQLYNLINIEEQMPITSAYYSVPVKFNEMSAVLRTLKHRLKTDQRLGYSLLIEIEEVTDGSISKLFPTMNRNKQIATIGNSMLNALLTGNQATVESELIECLTNLEEIKSSHSQIYQMFENVITRYQVSLNLTYKLADTQLLVYEAVYHSMTYETLLSNLLSLFGTIMPQSELEKRTKKHDFVERMKEYLNESYSEAITSDMLSKKFGYVSSYISRIFRQQTGYAPNEYITLLRMEAAKEIFCNQPELMVKEVAFMVGYKNQYHFSKTFKKEEGMWPSDYKKENSGESVMINSQESKS